MKKRIYEDDDGRRIADMSGIERPSLFTVRHAPEREQPRPPQEGEPTKTESDGPTMNRSERRAAVVGALTAALLISLVFMAGLGLGIWLLSLLWS